MRPPTPKSNWLPYLLIVVAWVLTRAYPLTHLDHHLDWQVWESKKLLEYGFAERQGAIIDVHYMTGRVPEPAKFNYVNHPYPILWADALAYYLGGHWGTVLFNSLLGLAGCLAVFPALSGSFPRNESLVGAMLFTIAPSTVVFNVDANTVALGALLWPLGVCLANRQRRLGEAGSAVPLGVAAFMCGQVSWFSYTVLPSLMGAGLGLGYQKDKGFTFNPRQKKMAVAVTLGGLVTLALFIGQILYYTYDLKGDLSYLQRQAGSHDGMPAARMFFTIALRAGLSLGPALLAGTLVGLGQLRRLGSIGWLELSSMGYLLVFAGSALVLRRFFFREVHMYQYLVFPCTVLAVAGLQAIRRPLFTRLLLLLAVAGLSYPLLRFAIPLVSQTTRNLGVAVSRISKPTEIVVTNLMDRQPPFAAWDVGSISYLNIICDRMFRENTSSEKDLDGLLKSFRTGELDMVFLYDKALPLEGSLLEQLRKSGQPESFQFATPEEPATFATALRTYYWKLAGKHQLQIQGSDVKQQVETEFEVYYFRLVKNDVGQAVILPAKSR